MPTLIDLRPAQPQLIADSEGADETETLLNLWSSLADTNASEAAVACVASAIKDARGSSRNGKVRAAHSAVRPR